MKYGKKLLVFFFLAANALLTKSKYECISPYILHDQYCYFFSNDATLYADALAFCKAENADLLSIHSTAANAFIRNHTTNELLIGLRYRLETNSYNWSDSSNLDFTNYADGFEAFKEYFGYCAKMDLNGKWANAECESDDLYFACQKQAFDVAISDPRSCPDSNAFYQDFGELLSPGYPETYDGIYGLECSYKLLAKNGYFINIQVEEASLGSDSIYVYKTFSTATKNLATTITNVSVNIATIIRTNMAFVVFSGDGKGTWKIKWDSVRTIATCEKSDNQQFHISDDWCFMFYGHTGEGDAYHPNNHCLVEMGAELPSIHSQAEQDVFTGLLSLSPGIAYQFLPLKFYADGGWKWTDGSEFDYSNFANDYAPDASPSTWIFNSQGMWHNGNVASLKFQFNCKRHVSTVPYTPSECSDSNAIFENYGEIFSPGYPKPYDGPDLFGCRVHLRAKRGYIILVFILINPGCSKRQVVNVYSGWQESQEHLMATIETDCHLISSGSGANTMLITHSALPNACWSASWYSTKDPTLTSPLGIALEEGIYDNNESLWEAQAPQASQCPHQLMEVYEDSRWKHATVTSPNYPAAYGTNQDCIWYSNSTYGLPDGFSYLVTFGTLKIAHDDYIRLIDLRTSTVFATTDTNIREGLSLAMNFHFAIEFHSGSVPTDFKRWRILLSTHQMLFT